MLRLWIIRFYAAPSGRRVVEDWYNDLSDNAQAAFDTTLEYLSQRRITEWGRPEYAPLTGKHGGLGELRFSAGMSSIDLLDASARSALRLRY
jgi:hypothetical protein